MSTAVGAPPAEVVERAPLALALARWSRRVMVAGWLCWAGLVVWGLQSGVLTSVGRLQEFVAGFGLLAPVAFVLVGASESVVPVVPGSLTIVSAPILFGPVLGSVAAYVATCLGSFTVFALSRHVGRDLLTARFRPATVTRYLRRLDDPSFPRWFALGIALPGAPDDLLCCLAGLSTVRTRTFVLVVLLLKPWGLLAYTFGVLTLLQHLLPGAWS